MPSKADMHAWANFVDDFAKGGGKPRRDTKRLVEDIMYCILALGGFDKLEDNCLLEPHDEKVRPWIDRYNELVHYEMTLDGPEETTGIQSNEVYNAFLERHALVSTWLAEGDWVDYCGHPVRNGLMVMMAPTPRHADDPLDDIRHRFRAIYYTTIGGGYETDPRKYLSMFMRTARLRREKDPFMPVDKQPKLSDNWIEIGEYLLDRKMGTKNATIVKRAHWRNEQKGLAVTIWQVLVYENIPKKAYELWEIAGWPQGRDLEFWTQAEQLPPKIFILSDIYDINVDRRKLSIFINTMVGSNSYTLAQERRAISKLRRMLTKEQYERYMVTGIFKEKSPKSGVTYFLRRSRPTLAFREHQGNRGLEWRFLAGLCMHPGAYYLASFAGSHCPTDDLINHLQYIRGDERRFWSKANHHRQQEVEIGLP